MSAPESAQRYRNADLPTKQYRLRHLRSVAARNISLRQTDGPDVSTVHIYFSLHLNSTEPAFYTSEKIIGSLNPTWRNFNFEQQFEEQEEEPMHASKEFTVKVWQGNEQLQQVCLQWHVHLNGLLYLGDRLQRDDQQYSHDSLIFGMFEGFYGAPSQTSPKLWDLRLASLEVDHSWVRESYSCQTLSRIQTILRAIRQTRGTCRHVKQRIQDQLRQLTPLQEKRSNQEMSRLKLQLLKDEIGWRRTKLGSQKDRLMTVMESNHQSELLLQSSYASLESERSQLHAQKKGYFDVREELIKTGAQLVLRRKQLMAELAFIYPITELAAGDYTISGVKLPNSEDFSGQDEMMIMVALGYTCHLIQMISQFLDIPLRYPMDHHGSRSMIRDQVIDKLSDKERDFPLFSKGREKFQFNYGVFLLNKNISQLRYYCGLGTTDLRLTLPNLKSLLELRLGVKFDAANTPMLAAQHMAVPPNLGGPQSMTSPSFTNQPIRALTEDQVHREPPVSQDNSDIPNTQVNASSDETAESFANIPVTVHTREFPKCSVKPVNTDSVPVGVGDNLIPRSPCTKTISHEDLFRPVPDSFFTVSKSAHNLTSLDKENIPADSSSPRSIDDRADPIPMSMAVPHKNRTLSEHTGNSMPENQTLDQLTKEKLLGSIANYEDIEVSSSDSSSRTYNSRFKHWPRSDKDSSLHSANASDLSHVSGDNSYEDSANISESTHPAIDLSFKTRSRPSSSYSLDSDGFVHVDKSSSIMEHSPVDFTFSDEICPIAKTFKTRAMQRTSSKESVEYDEVATDPLEGALSPLATASKVTAEAETSKDSEAETGIQIETQADAVGSHRRERSNTESSSDESATFVLPSRTVLPCVEAESQFS